MKGLHSVIGFLGGQYLKITDEFTEYTLPEGKKAYFTSRAQTPYEFLPIGRMAR